MNRIYRLMIVMIFLLFLTSCKENPEVSEPTFLPEVDVIEQELTLPSFVEEGLLELPSSYKDVSLTWETSDPSVISASGEVSRIFEDDVVIITAYYVFQDIEKSKTFEVTVIGKPLTALEIVQKDLDALVLPSETNENITLPTWGTYGSAIVWTSNMAHVLSRTGIYYAPIEDELVTLTATIRFEDQELIKTFDINVRSMSDIDKVEKDHVMLELRVPSPLGNITLPSRGYFTSNITWSSSHPEIISSTGLYQKPIGELNVILTATITKGSYTMEKTFEVNVQGYNPEDIIKDIDRYLLINHGIDVIFEDLSLPQKLFNLVAIRWHSSHPEIISDTGEFHIPNQTTSVTLTAEMTIDDMPLTKSFVYTVYGLSDTSSEVVHQHIPMVQFDLSKVYHLDDSNQLTSGIFDQIVYRNNRLMLAGNALEGSYVSPIFKADQALKRINFMWGSISHAHAKTSFYLRYLSSTGWSDEYLQGTWGYGGENLPPQITFNFPKDVFEVQYKIVLRRDTIAIPSPEITFVSLQPITETMQVYTTTSLRTSVLYDVPQLKQADTKDAFLWNNICWATSISMMLQYYQKLTDLDIPQEYYSVLIRQGTERFGTTKNDIGSTQFGMILHELEFHSKEMLLHVLDNYGPLIIGVSKGTSPTGDFGPIKFSSGHVVVVVGYEIHENGQIDIIINDPAVSWMRFPIKGSIEELMMVWDKGGMLMQPQTTR